MPPSLFRAMGMAFRAVTRSPALIAGGLGVALLSRALAWPVVAVGSALVAEAAMHALRARPFDPGAPVAGALAMLTSARFVLLVGGLWLTSLAARGALRVAFLAGAFPQLAGEMAGVPGPRFAAGAAFGFARVLPAAALGFLADLTGTGFAAVLVVAALRIAGHAPQPGAAVLLAAATALALVLALAVPLALSGWSDAGVARAALRGEAPGQAFAAATRRFLARPGTFILAVLGFGIAGVIAPSTVQGFSGIATGFAPHANPLVLAGPSLMMGVLATVVTAAIDLGWLGTVAALACAGEAAEG
ncbi:MAG: hypothetical protein U0229_02430 [Anaeromyxobacter sp.]